MPQAMRYVPPTDMKTRREFEWHETRELRERKALFEKGERYYKGEQPPPLLVEEGEVDDNVIVNATKQVIDRTLSFLFPSMPQFQLDPASDQETDEERYLREAWSANEGPVFLNKLAYNGALSGHCFVRVLPPAGNRKFGRLVNIHPSQIVAYWKADDVDTILWYEVCWTIGKVEYLVDFVNLEPQGPQLLDDGTVDTATWRIYEYERGQSSRDWTLTNTINWYYPLSPIYSWQHLPTANEFYGTPETTPDQRRLNRSINKVASDVNRILRFHAYPKTIGIGIDPNEVQPTGIDNFWATPNPDANIFNLEMKSDLASSMNYLSFLNDAFLSQSRVVIMKGTVKDFQRVTNAGIRAVFLDMIAKNYVLRWTYGTALQELSLRLLMVGGYAIERKPDVIWDDPLPQDDTEMINTLALERDMRIVSHETASHKRGYSWLEEVERMEKESKISFLQPVTANTGTSPTQKADNRPEGRKPLEVNT